MSANDNNTPPGKSPFWLFSVRLYGLPGVAPACIALQKNAAL